MGNKQYTHTMNIFKNEFIISWMVFVISSRIDMLSTLKIQHFMCIELFLTTPNYSATTPTVFITGTVKQISALSRLCDSCILQKLFQPHSAACLYLGPGLLFQEMCVYKVKWCFTQTQNQGATEKHFQLHNWQYEPESIEIHVIQIWNTYFSLKYITGYTNNSV